MINFLIKIMKCYINLLDFYSKCYKQVALEDFEDKKESRQDAARRRARSNGTMLAKPRLQRMQTKAIDLMPVQKTDGLIFEEKHVNVEGAKGPCFIWAVEFSKSTKVIRPLDGAQFHEGAEGKYSGLMASACWNGTAYVYATDKLGQWHVVREVRAGPGEVLDRVFDISLVEIELFKETGKPTTLLAVGGRDKKAKVFDVGQVGEIKDEVRHESEQEDEIDEEAQQGLPPTRRPSALLSPAEAKAALLGTHKAHSLSSLPTLDEKNGRGSIRSSGRKRAKGKRNSEHASEVGGGGMSVEEWRAERQRKRRTKPLKLLFECEVS